MDERKKAKLKKLEWLVPILILLVLGGGTFAILQVAVVKLLK